MLFFAHRWKEDFDESAAGAAVTGLYISVNAVK